MPSDPAVVARPTVRILLVDDRDRLLLFAAGQRQSGSLRWFAAGGGVEAGETYEQAALREIREETGITDVTLSRQVWRGQPWTAVRDGVGYEIEQHYFLARVPAADIDTSGFEDFERAAITGHRWWTLAELAATDDLLRPAELPQLLARLLDDGLPDQPITVSS